MKPVILLSGVALALSACANETPEQKHEVGCMAGTLTGAVIGGLAGSLIGGGAGRRSPPRRARVSARSRATAWRASEGGADENIPDRRRRGAGVRRRRRRTGPQHRASRRIDANGDGAVDKAEFDAFVAGSFTTLDANGDGFVTLAEATVVMTPEHFAAANTNGDDGLSQEEFTAAAAADFAAADQDGDGMLN